MFLSPNTMPWLSRASTPVCPGDCTGCQGPTPCVCQGDYTVKGQHSCGVSWGLYWLPRANTPVCPGDDVKGQHSCVSRGQCQGPTPCVSRGLHWLSRANTLCVSRGLHWLSRSNTPVCPQDCTGCQGQILCVCPGDCTGCQGPTPCVCPGDCTGHQGPALQGTALAVKGQHPYRGPGGNTAIRQNKE